jgi:transglutaminase-like putative cysteine protease
MSVLLSLRHLTRYRYDRPVALGPHEVRLKPAPVRPTSLAAYDLAVRPAPRTTKWYHDAAGNAVARLLFDERTPGLELEVSLAIELAPVNPFDFLVAPDAERFPFRYDEATRAELCAWLAPAEDGGRLRDWLGAFRCAERPEGGSTVELLVGLNRRLRSEVAYVAREEHGVQSAEETLRLGRGSCRDSAWLLAQALRQLGIAARFVSGYLIQLAGEAPDAPAADGAELHAWAEAYLPGAGWIGLDPTSGLLAAEAHVPLARAASPVMAAPVTGSVEPCRSEMEYSISVRRV